MSVAVVLFNLGGPDRPEAVEPFLFNLFNDPAIIGSPGFIRRRLARLISRRRAPVAREIYGPAAEYVARPEPALVASALDRVLTDNAVRTRLLQAGAAQRQRYSWIACARRTLHVLLASAHPPSPRLRWTDR